MHQLTVKEAQSQAVFLNITYKTFEISGQKASQIIRTNPEDIKQ